MADQLSATEQLIQQLRRPQQDKTQDVIRALTAFTSPETQKQVLATMPKQSALSPEEQRLAAAAKLEESMMKKEVNAALKGNAQEAKERKEIRTQLAPALAGTKRSKLVRDHVKALNDINTMENMIEMAIQDKSPIVEADKYNISALWSGVLTGGVPTQTLIEKSIYNSAQGAYMDLKEWAFGDRSSSTYTKDDLRQMRSQLNILKAAKSQAYGKTLERALAPYRSVLEKYPDQQQFIADTYGDVLNVDGGKFKSKQFDPETGLESQSITETQQQQDSVNRSPSPHGDTVEQGGITYVWDGSQYVEDK